MKLRDYLSNMHQDMPDKDKLVVFERIRGQIERESIFKRVSFYTKVGVYSIFLMFIFFGMFYHQNNFQNFQIEQNGSSVMADYIGKIITSTGSFQILEGNKNIDTKVIKKGDILKINDNSNLTIGVNEGIKLYVIGPAKIQLDKYQNDEGKNIYVFNMLDGKYLTVKSNSAKDKIVIRSKYLNIESNDKLIDLKYEKKGNATIIENNGGDIIVKNDKKVLALSNKEKLVFLDSSSVKQIKNIFSDGYKNYQMTESGNVKTVISSEKISQLSHILSKENAILATGKFVLGKLNSDKNREESGKKQLIQILFNTYKILGIDIPSLLETKRENNSLTISDLENLVDNLLVQIETNYIVPEQFTQRLKVILAYLVIVEKVKVQPGQTFQNLSYLVNYLKLDDKYKRMLLTF